ncbi:MAG TPA: hypothetical protein VN873_03230 [Candidatus Angelobacter sp.]|nr:hypothetical protein [Candidatus Angelobacter sp.]
MLPVLYYPRFEPDQHWLRSILLLVDGIQRIIPPEACHSDSRRTRELIEVMPEAIKTIVPTDADKDFDDLNFDRLKKAFAKIRDKAERKPDKVIHFHFNDRGNATMTGDAWLSSAKLQERVRRLLMEYDLASEVRNPYTGRSAFVGDTFPANEEASNLIVSYVADRIAKRTGMDTITDLEIPHAVQSFDALNLSPLTVNRESEGLLVAAIATTAIPVGVSSLTVHEFQELRQSYSDVRIPFNELISSLATYAKLDRQQSAAAAEKRIQLASAEYQRQMKAYRESRFARKFDQWIPIAIKSILAVLAVAAANKEMRLALAAAGIAIDVMKEGIAAQHSPPENEKVFRMLCKMERDIDKMTVADLI